MRSHDAILAAAGLAERPTVDASTVRCGRVDGQMWKRRRSDVETSTVRCGNVDGQMWSRRLRLAPDPEAQTDPWCDLEAAAALAVAELASEMPAWVVVDAQETSRRLFQRQRY